MIWAGNYGSEKNKSIWTSPLGSPRCHIGKIVVRPVACVSDAIIIVFLFIYCRHENASGFYRVSAYFLAKIFCDVIPMRAIPVAVFASITYWMIGINYSAALLTYTSKYFFIALLAGLC